jgi:hypothetical protein
VLCIDPETRLPFMINMGLKTADIIDLDNRPEELKALDAKQADLSQSIVSDQWNQEGGSGQTMSALLNPRHYPFYQKVKRSMYVIEKLLNDDSNQK